MLLNSQPAQVEQPIEGIKIVDKGQGLPQEKPFSQHLASIKNLSTKQAATSNSMAKDKLVTTNDLPDSIVDVATLLDGKTISVDDIKQDPDALDTWFSSWLWPISVFDGINHPNNKEIEYYYPTNDLVTGPDIIFFATFFTVSIDTSSIFLIISDGSFTRLCIKS